MADITQHRNAHHSEVNMHEVKGFLSASKGYSYSKNIQGASEWERNFRRPNAKALIFGYEAPTTENDGDVYSITAPEIDINGILHQSGTTVRFTFSAGYDSSLYAANSYFQVSGETGEAIHNGVWLITTVNASYLEVTNSGVTDNTQDVASSSPAVGYVTHEDYDPASLSNSQSIPRIGMVRFFDTQDLWFGDAFQSGDEYYNEALNSKETFNGADVVNTIGYKVYTALLTQTGTDAPVATVLENTLGADITWTYEAVGSYKGTSTGNLFTTSETTILGGSVWGVPLYDCMFYTDGDNTNEVWVKTLTRADGVLIDAKLTRTTIEIRVYN